MALPEDMIGAIKIKDGLFIGDEFAAQVSQLHPLCQTLMVTVGPRVRSGEQSDPYNKLCSKTGA